MNDRGLGERLVLNEPCESCGAGLPPYALVCLACGYRVSDKAGDQRASRAEWFEASLPVIGILMAIVGIAIGVPLLLIAGIGLLFGGMIFGRLVYYMLVEWPIWPWAR